MWNEESVVPAPHNRYQSTAILTNFPRQSLKYLLVPSVFYFLAFNFSSFLLSPFLLVAFNTSFGQPKGRPQRCTDRCCLGPGAGRLPRALPGLCLWACRVLCWSLLGVLKVRCQKWLSASAGTFLRLLNREVSTQPQCLLNLFIEPGLSYDSWSFHPANNVTPYWRKCLDSLPLLPWQHPQTLPFIITELPFLTFLTS